MSQSIAVGMVGYKFMGKAHSNAYRQINQFFDLPLRPRLKSICGRDNAKVEKMAERWGWENAVDDWRRIIDDPEIKIVDICSPNNTHHDIAIAAFQAGKIVACEKPLAMSGKQAEQMAAAARRSGAINTVWYQNDAGQGIERALLGSGPCVVAREIRGRNSSITIITRTPGLR